MEVLFEIEARKQEQLSAIKAAINLWITFTNQPKTNRIIAQRPANKTRRNKIQCSFLRHGCKKKPREVATTNEKSSKDCLLHSNWGLLGSLSTFLTLAD